jgi:hypothetical protein
VSQVKVREAQETQWGPQREGLRLLARLIATHVLATQSKQRGEQDKTSRSSRINRVAAEKERTDEWEDDAKGTEEDQGL